MNIYHLATPLCGKGFEPNRRCQLPKLFVEVKKNCQHQILRKKCILSRRRQGCQMAYFKPKIRILVNFGGSYNGGYMYLIPPFVLFYRHFVYICTYLYILWLFGIFLPALVWCTKANLATLGLTMLWHKSLCQVIRSILLQTERATLDPFFLSRLLIKFRNQVHDFKIYNYNTSAVSRLERFFK
jgi:hypothetical protein